MDVQRSTTTLRQRARFTSRAPQPAEARATLPVVGEVSNLMLAGGGAALFVLLLIGSRGDGAPNVTIN